MPEIDLPPGKYRWRRPMSKPLAVVYIVAGLAAVAWTITKAPPGSLPFMLAGCIMSAAVALIVAGLLRDID